MLSFLVSMRNRFGESVQLFAVIEFDFRFTFENILKFVDNAHLNFQPVVKAFQLLVQLDSDVWKWIKKLSLYCSSFPGYPIWNCVYKKFHKFNFHSVWKLAKKSHFSLLRWFSKCLDWIFQFWDFPAIFVQLKLTCLVTLQFSGFQKLVKIDYFWHF